MTPHEYKSRLQALHEELRAVKQQRAALPERPCAHLIVENRPEAIELFRTQRKLQRAIGELMLVFLLESLPATVRPRRAALGDDDYEVCYASPVRCCLYDLDESPSLLINDKTCVLCRQRYGFPRSINHMILRKVGNEFRARLS